MNRSSLPVNVSRLKKWWDSEEKTLRCTLPFQRHAGVWNVYTKSSLIWSMLADSYVPPIVLLKDKAGEDVKNKDAFVYEILDGQQRLTNIFGFINDEWALHSATPVVTVDGFEYEIAGRKFSELEEELQNAVTQFSFSVQRLENYTMEEAEALFFNINSGVNLSPVQKSKSKMGTELIKFFTGLLGGAFFSQAVNMTEVQAKREDDLLMLLQSAMLLDSRHEGTEYKLISAAHCLSYAESIRGTYNKDKQAMLSEVVAYLDRAFTFKNKFLSRNNVSIVVVMAKVALENGVEEKTFSGFVNLFANSIYPSYKEASGSGNVKAKNTQMRLRVMFLALCRHLGLDASEIKAPFAEGIPLYEGLLEEDGLLPVRGTPVESVSGGPKEASANEAESGGGERQPDKEGGAGGEEAPAGEENPEVSGESPGSAAEGADGAENATEGESGGEGSPHGEVPDGGEG